MFSSIIGLLKGITKSKYKKEKKETNKKIKQEEIKILKKLKNKLVGSAHEKAKELETVKDSKKKEKKLKAQVWLLNILQTFIQFLEFAFGSIIATVILIVLCVAIIFIVIWIALNGIMNLDIKFVDSDVTGINSESQEGCIQGSQAIIDLEFDESLLNSLGGTLTDQQKQLYRAAKVYTDIYNGTFGDPTELFNTKYAELIKRTDLVSKVAVTMGFMSIENGFSFPGSTNIFTEPMTTQPDTNNDAWLGMEAEKKDFDGKYEGNQYYSQSFVDNFKKSYSYSNWSGLISCYNYGPYGIATQVGTLSGYFSSTPQDEVVSLVEKYAKEFGVSANLDTLTGLCQYFMIANGYHGRSSSMTEPNVIFWVALWASTSENDAERGFDKIILNHSSYAEGTYRGEILGYSSYAGTYGSNPCTISNLTYEPGDTTNGYIKINGQVLNKPLIKYVSDYCDSKGKTDIFKPVVDDLNGRAYAPTLGQAVLNQNYAYGLVAYLAGMKVMSDLGVSMPVVSGGNIEDCDCYESGSTPSVVFSDFLFIGDSYTDGLRSIAEGKGHIVKASVGATCAEWVGATTSTKTMGINKDSFTLSDINESDINGIVVLLGANSPTQQESMKSFLNELKGKYPNIPIYVQKTFPMGSNYTYQDVATYNGYISTFNNDIKSYCNSNGFTYIDTTTNLVTSDGYLLHPDGEGIHLSSSEGDYNVWWSNIENSIKGRAVSNNSSVNCIDTVVNGEFKETPGQFQGAWGDLTESINSMTNTAVRDKLLAALPYVGTAPKNEGESNYLYETDKFVALNGKGVVRYSQTRTRNLGEDWAGLSYGDSTYYAAACGAYSTACIISTLTGRYVNTVEVAMAVSTYEIRHPASNLALSNMDGGGGAFTYTDLAAVMRENGLNVETSWTLSKDKVDACLNNNGMILLVVGNAYSNRFTTGGHYVVIREKTSDGYLIYSSTNWSNASTDDYCNTANTWSEVATLNNGKGQIAYVTP